MVAPYKPAAQGVQAAAPAREYCPTAQLDAVPLVDPAGHAYPAVQPPEHADEDRPVVSPYLPLGHDVHEEAPLREYVPVAHTMSVGVVDPPGHAYPAVQLPEHSDDARPDVAPYLPPGQAVHEDAPANEYCPVTQAPEHAEVDSPVLEPKVPARQLVHAAAPPSEYWPTAQAA